MTTNSRSKGGNSVENPLPDNPRPACSGNPVAPLHNGAELLRRAAQHNEEWQPVIGCDRTAVGRLVLVPGGGPMARLPRLIGRGRALEVLLGANDISAELAERWGYVNRALPDAELDAFVDGLALRISSFDKQAIAETKRLVDLASLPPDTEIAPEWDAFLASLARPASQTRIKALMERGFHRPGDVEERLGYHVGQLGG
jgi:hypothetical protein